MFIYTSLALEKPEKYLYTPDCLMQSYANAKKNEVASIQKDGCLLRDCLLLLWM